jgi:hypothetical protein
MKNHQTQRRRFLKFGGTALVMIPAMITFGQAQAAKNASMRTALKYQGKPEGDKSCAQCAHFVPGKSAKAMGGCKVIAGDTEISPTGYCTAWVKKA